MAIQAQSDATLMRNRKIIADRGAGAVLSDTSQGKAAVSA
jgi:hypothetical protein